jgi:XTP/dITP diphosphohydrolase
MSAEGPYVPVILATRNPGKVREIVAIYARLELELRSLAGYPEVPQIREDGATYADNAAAKARAAALRIGLVALADDSGIEVDALSGAPGVQSARFLGPSATDTERNARILLLLEGVPEARRTARYRAAVAVARPDGTVRVFDGICEGRVALAPRGAAGFGYDPIFMPEGAQETMAEIPLEMKNRISHRARALRAAEPYLREILGLDEQDRRVRGAK